ncbi:MAG: Pirin, partial [uncultured Craurococcus sp.]
ELESLPRADARRPSERWSNRDPDRAARGGPRRDDGAPGPAFHQAADGRAVHLLRPDGPGRVPDRPRHRRAAPPAHQPGDAHLPVRGRDPAPRQPRHGKDHPAGRRELDAGRPRHRPFRAHRGRAQARRAAPVRHPDLDGVAGEPGGERPRVHAPRRRGVAAGRSRRRPGAADRRARLRRGLAACDGFRDPLRRHPARGGRPHADRRRLRRACGLHDRRDDRGGGRRVPAGAVAGAPARRRGHRGRDHGRALHAVRRRPDGGAALHLVELRLFPPGAHRGRERGMGPRPLRHRPGRRGRVHPPARQARPAATRDRRRVLPV